MMIAQNEATPLLVERLRELADRFAMLEPRQCKAARSLLGWTQADLAAHSGVGVGSIKDFESRHHGISLKALMAIVRTLQSAGIILLFPDDGGDVGVRLRRKKE